MTRILSGGLLATVGCLLTLAACSGDDDGSSGGNAAAIAACEDFYDKLQGCGLATEGRTGCENDATTIDGSCASRCVAQADCSSLEGAVCEDSGSFVACIQGCSSGSGETFSCGDGDEIPADWRCDGEEDCDNGSDEAGCSGSGNTFTCGSGETVPESFECDQYPDCQDGSDEAGCAQIQCGGAG